MCISGIPLRYASLKLVEDSWDSCGDASLLRVEDSWGLLWRRFASLSRGFMGGSVRTRRLIESRIHGRCSENASPHRVEDSWGSWDILRIRRIRRILHGSARSLKDQVRNLTADRHPGISQKPETFDLRLPIFQCLFSFRNFLFRKRNAEFIMEILEDPQERPQARIFVSFILNAEFIEDPR